MPDFKNKEEYEKWKEERAKNLHEVKDIEQPLQQTEKQTKKKNKKMFSFFYNVKDKIAEINSESINFYQRVVLVLGAIVLIVVL